MKFQDFWGQIEAMGSDGSQCPSQGRGTPVNFRIESQRLICKSLGRDKDAEELAITKEQAKIYFEKLAGGVPRFGGRRGCFRYDHGAWFHDIYAAITGDDRK